MSSLVEYRIIKYLNEKYWNLENINNHIWITELAKYCNKGANSKTSWERTIAYFFCQYFFFDKTNLGEPQHKYLINKRFLFRNDRFRYLRVQKKALQPASPWLVISPWREKQSSALFWGLLAFGTCVNPFRDPSISGKWYWRTKCTVNTSKYGPFSTTLGVGLVFFSSLRKAIYM